MDKRPNRPDQVPEDEEYTVAPMNLEGMPWYTPQDPAPKNPNAEPLTGKNLWRYAFSAVGAGLLIVMIFGLGGAALIWFCINVWFR
ncbi:MAG: hypothetical protein VB099_20690 [Candidatus Limiplasma sp.]|nr:hypothetical protein [Candidatus Limiplasma sp.]